MVGVCTGPVANVCYAPSHTECAHAGPRNLLMLATPMCLINVSHGLHMGNFAILSQNIYNPVSHHVSTFTLLCVEIFIIMNIDVPAVLVLPTRHTTSLLAGYKVLCYAPINVMPHYPLLNTVCHKNPE